MTLQQRFKVKAIQHIAGVDKNHQTHRITLLMLDVPAADGQYRLVPPASLLMPTSQQSPSPELTICVTNPVGPLPFELHGEFEMDISGPIAVKAAATTRKSERVVNVA